MARTVDWIWFQLMFGFGTRRAELFMAYFADPAALYAEIAAQGRAAGMLTPKEKAGVERAMERAAELERRTRAKGCDILTPDHPHYPPLLAQIYAKPAALYAKGDTACLCQTLCIAMVGTRYRTEYGRDAAAHIARGLAQGGAVVVSGLAKGIDTDSHRAALEAGGKTVGILGCGLDIDYPKGSAGLKTAMCQNGAVISEYPFGVRPSAYTFPVRNRLIAGMCHGTVVVEADLNSGSLITAQYALEQGRDVFAVPGGIFSARARGTHRLLRDGAKLTESAQDVFDEYAALGYMPASSAAQQPPKEKAHAPARDIPPVQSPKQEKPEPPSGLTPAAEALLSALSRTPVTVEELAARTELATGDLLSALTELEIYGLIQGYPGRSFGLY